MASPSPHSDAMSAPVNGRPPDPWPAPACSAGATGDEPDDRVWPPRSVPGPAAVVAGEPGVAPGTTGVAPGTTGVVPDPPGKVPDPPGKVPGPIGTPGVHPV